MSQLAFEGMPDRLFAASPARLTTYLDCPRRYRFAYVDRPTPPRGAPWARTSVGASVHTALARWWGLPRSRRTPAAGAALLDAAWLTDGFRDADQSRRALARSRGQVRRYLADVDPDHEPVAVERTVTVRTRRASLWGRVDRIDDRGGEGLAVVDYKTGRTPPTAEDAGSSLALAVYAAAAARTLRRTCTRVELHHLPSGTVAGWDHTTASLDRELRLADALAAELAAVDSAAGGADELFPARVGSRCGWCDFRSSCGPGQAVPRQQPWAGVED
jgi:RecB family exonuclease